MPEHFRVRCAARRDASAVAWSRFRVGRWRMSAIRCRYRMRPPFHRGRRLPSRCGFVPARPLTPMMRPLSWIRNMSPTRITNGCSRSPILRGIAACASAWASGPIQKRGGQPFLYHSRKASGVISPFPTMARARCSSSAMEAALGRPRNRDGAASARAIISFPWETGWEVITTGFPGASMKSASPAARGNSDRLRSGPSMSAPPTCEWKHRRHCSSVCTTGAGNRLWD